MKLTREQQINCVVSEISDLIYETERSSLCQEHLLTGISEILRYAGVDSEFVVDVLERPEFGEIGKDIARDIKVDEGW